MSSSSPNSATLRLFQSLLPRLLFLMYPLALSSCDRTDSLLDPSTDGSTGSPAALSSGPASTAGTVQRIVFTSWQHNGDIYRVDPQGTKAIPLTTTSAYDQAPAWSYDNQRVAFLRERQDGLTTSRDLYLINADGSNGHWLRATPFPFPLAEPSWSPDGSRIVLTITLSAGAYVATMNLATGNATLVGGGAILGHYPSFDPTGQKIIYLSTDWRSIRQVNSDGTGGKTLYSAATTLGHPSFSPDGQKIVFSRDLPVVNNTYNREIFVKNLATGSVKRVTFSNAVDQDPTWSPDGSKIAFASSRSGGIFHIYTMSASGSTATRITQTGSEEGQPAWTH